MCESLYTLVQQLVPSVELEPTLVFDGDLSAQVKQYYLTHRPDDGETVRAKHRGEVLPFTM